MHRRVLFCVMLLGILASACQGPPPTQIVLVVTATPEGFVAQGVAGADPLAGTSSPDQTTTPATPATTTLTPSPAVASATPAPLPGTGTPVVLVQPTPTVRQIQVAEQIFERGRMFWLQPTAQIWVMVLTGEGVGDWYVYEDFFKEGDPEFDPGIVPPDDELKQPIRGFGRLWRENSNVREQLGWATTDEFGFVTRYEYHPALALEDDVIVPLQGEHVLCSLYGEGFRFIEESGAWRLN